MKRTVYLMIVSLCAGMLLSACSGAASASQALPSQAAGAEGSQPGQLAGRLALGMFKLDSSAYPVDAEQAAALLPLWKAARALGKSDSTADDEVAGLVKQIQSSLTSQQLQLIQDMTAEDMRQIAQEQGLVMNTTGAPPAGAMPTQSAGAGSMGGPGGMMGGPPGMGGPGDGGSSSQTTEKTTTESGSFQGVSMAVLDAIIKSLQTKVQ